MKFTDEKPIIAKNTNFIVKQTLQCGQVFRFKPYLNGYIIYSADKACYLTQDDSEVKLYTNYKDYFENYFDLSTDYGKIVNSLSKFPELIKPIEFGSGIRILNQPLYETVISFIISANNNIPRIKSIIERLCEFCGDKMDGYYAFPTLNQLLKLSKDDFTKLGCGFRADYLYTSARLLQDGILDNIDSLSSIDAQKQLCKLKGVGAKVANCIMLFGLRRMESYPVDTWIFQANKTDILNTPLKVQEYYQNRYGEYAGYAQQYIFYHAREGGIKG